MSLLIYTKGATQLTEIIFYHSKICPRCIRTRHLVNEIEEEFKNVDIIRLGSVTKFLKRELHTLPALQIGEKIFYGKEITRENILIELTD